MNLLVNGTPTQIDQATTVHELLGELGYRDSFVAVALNRACVRRSEFASTPLAAGDEVEILAPMAGG